MKLDVTWPAPSRPAETLGMNMIKRILLALDIAVNMLFNGRVETISARAGRAARKGKPWGKKLCEILDQIDDNHCVDADQNGPFRDK